MALQVYKKTTTTVIEEIDTNIVPVPDDTPDDNNPAYEYDSKYPAGDYRAATGAPMPQGGTAIVPGVEGLILPEDAPCSWNSNGDSVVPYLFKKKGWDVEFDISLNKAVAGTYFMRMKIISCPETPTVENPIRLKVQMSDILDKENRFWNLASTKGDNRFAIGKDYWIDINANLLTRKIDVVGQTSKRGETLYVYSHTNNYSTGKLCFATDGGGEFKRATGSSGFMDETP